MVLLMSNVITSNLKFELDKLVPQKASKIGTVTHTRVQGCTIFDKHMEGLINGNGGCDCHYFIGALGEVYEGKSVKYQCADQNGKIVIQLEGNFENKDATQEQKDALVALASELGLKKIEHLPELAGSKFNLK